jgi:hypothetical protein
MASRKTGTGWSLLQREKMKIVRFWEKIKWENQIYQLRKSARKLLT